MAVMSDLISQVRNHLADYTVLQVNVSEEIPVASKPQSLPHVSYNYWNQSATGKNYEEFLTKKTPLVSGSKVMLKGGRWNYDYKGEWPGTGSYTAYSSTGRSFLIDYYRGIFTIPSGAIPIASGDKVLLTYSYWEDQEYTFSDNEIISWTLDGDKFLRGKVSLPWVISGNGQWITMTPFPSGGWLSLLALSTSYFMRLRLQEEGVRDGIYIKTGTTAFDTTKTLAHRGKSLEQVKKDLDDIVTSVLMGDLSSAGARIDTYSTYSSEDDLNIGYYQEYNRTGFPGFWE